MSCGCSGNPATGQRRRHVVGAQPSTTTASAAPVSSAAKVFYEIWRNGKYTGRRSESLVSAQSIAGSLGPGAEVRPSR